MTLFIKQKTECISCKKKIFRFFPNIFFTYKKRQSTTLMIQSNICSFCKRHQIHIDVNEILKLIR